MGGIFGEGIDLVGDRLSGAVIVGVGLPGISLERELIKAYFNNQQDSGFEYAYLYPGMNRVFQAAGRVIRTATDRGVVLLIGSRFSTHHYRTLLPSHWHPLRIRDDPHLQEILEQFWSTPLLPKASDCSEQEDMNTH
jgi:DNA excision repair protein ERCC-2